MIGFQFLRFILLPPSVIEFDSCQDGYVTGRPIATFGFHLKWCSRPRGHAAFRHQRHARRRPLHPHFPSVSLQITPSFISLLASLEKLAGS
jgi:hypothetical protein